LYPIYFGQYFLSYLSNTGIGTPEINKNSSTISIT